MLYKLFDSGKVIITFFINTVRIAQLMYISYKIYETCITQVNYKRFN